MSVSRSAHRFSGEERERASLTSRLWRAQHRKSQAELAEVLGVKRQDVGILERAPVAANSKVVKLVLERLAAGGTG